MATTPKFSFPMPTEDTLRLIPKRLAERFKLLPIRRTSTTLTVVTSNPSNMKMLEDLERQFGLKIDARQVPEHEMVDALAYVFGKPSTPPRKRGGLADGQLSSAQISARPGDRIGLERSSIGPSNDGHRRLTLEVETVTKAGTKEAAAGSPATPDPSESVPEDLEESLGSLGDLDLDREAAAPPPAARAAGRPPEPPPSEEISPLIERGRARDQVDGGGGPARSKLRSGEVSATDEIDDLMLAAVRMGASEIFLDALSDRFLLRARIGFRCATLGEFSTSQGGEIIEHLRSTAGLRTQVESPRDTGVVQLRPAPGQAVDVFLSTFPTRMYECQVMDVIRHPGTKLKPLAPRGIAEGSPTKLRDLLASQLGDRRLASVIARQLTRPPTVLAVATPRHRHRESIMAMLAAAVAGPALGQRTLYVGERPRYYLEEQGALLMRTQPEVYHQDYSRAARMRADYLFLEECSDYDDLALATQASVSQHVIVGIAAADPVDLLTYLTEAPEPRRLAQRLGSILFLDAASMKIVEMTQTLREAVGAMQEASVFVRLFDGAGATERSRPTPSGEVRGADPFKLGE